MVNQLKMEKEYLYKLMPFNKNALMLLLRHELYFASPESLNDPIDCMFNISVKNRLQLTELDLIPIIEKYWDNGSRNHKLAEDCLKHDSILLSLIFSGIRAKIKDRIAVCSFSTEREIDQRLWSHYADASNGLCLIFDKNILSDHFCSMDYNVNQTRIYGQNVNYDGKPFEIEIRNGDFELKEDYFFNKTKEWDYEKEFRFVISSDFGWKHYSDYDKIRYCCFPKNGLVGIILGEKMSSYDEWTIVELVNTLEYPCTVRKNWRNLEDGKIYLSVKEIIK